MDARLLKYYNQELTYLHESGQEFAQQFPKIAARLGMQGIEVTDPYVERLLEGVAFLTARVQLKLDAEFPQFTEQLLQMIYPSFLAPTPSMLMAQFKPQLGETNLATGFTLPRDSSMRSLLGKADSTACEFRTCQPVTLWPIELIKTEYFAFLPGDRVFASTPSSKKIKSSIRLTLKTSAGLKWEQLQLNQLPFYFGGNEDVAYQLMELCLAASLGFFIGDGKQFDYLPVQHVQPLGYADEHALLPTQLRSFQGYRLLKEYFAFPERFLFVELNTLAPTLQKIATDQLEIVLLFENEAPTLKHLVQPANFLLFCTPAINLFPKRMDRIDLQTSAHEYHVVADRTRPMDFEIYDINHLSGYAGSHAEKQLFLPFYAASHAEHSEQQAYFTLQRQPRLLSAKQKTKGFRSNYIGTEVFIALVDPQQAPYSGQLKQLAVQALCTNRDLAWMLGNKAVFTLDTAAPITGIGCIRGPSKPYSPTAEGAAAWRFIHHLSLNYLSLLTEDAQQGLVTLQKMLALYAQDAQQHAKNHINGLRALQVQPIVRRLPTPGPIAFGRGLKITITLDENEFQGGSAFLFGHILAHFFARYASINSFTETVLYSTQRGYIKQWMPQCGTRPIF